MSGIVPKLGDAMSVTARFSKNFYDRFGDEAANELVEWFNAVDLTYRTDLRDFNETNFARFDAKLDGLQVTEHFAKVEERFAQIDMRFERVDARFDGLAGLLKEHLLTVEGRFDRFEARMLRWVLTFWVGTLMGLAALVWAMVRAR